MSSSIVRTLTVVLLAGTAGCLASKNDVRLLQDEIRTNRAAEAHEDSARQVQTDSLMRLLGVYRDQLRDIQSATQDQLRQYFASNDRQLQTFRDSLAVVSSQLLSFKAGTSELLGQIGTDLSHTAAQQQALQGSLQRLAAQDQPTVPATPATTPVVGGDSAHGQPPAGTPSAAALMEEARQEYAQGSISSERSALEMLLATYPNGSEARAAQLMIGTSYQTEGNATAADSVYALVAAHFPGTDEAVTAMYKHGLLLCQAGKKTEAVALFKKIAKDGPSWADSYQSAKDRASSASPCSS